MYADADGQVFGNSNGGGLYKIDKTGNDPALTFFKDSVATGNNDGAECLGAVQIQTASNNPPIAENDTGVTPINTTLAVTAANGLFKNDVKANAYETLIFDGATVTIGSTPVTIPTGVATELTGYGTITINYDGSYTFVPANDFVGDVPAITYTVLGDTGSETADLNITVNPAIDATNDTLNTLDADGKTASVIGNDTKNGTAASLGGSGNVTITSGTAPTDPDSTSTLGFFGSNASDATSNNNITFDTASGNFTVADATPAGTYTYRYEICLKDANPVVCDVAIATITVPAPSDAVIATNDSFSDIATGATTGSVLGNDTVDGNAADNTNVTITADVNNPFDANSGPLGFTGSNASTGSDNITFNANSGTFTIGDNTPAGTYNYRYEICSKNSDPAVCDVAVATITVSAALQNDTAVFRPGNNLVLSPLNNDTSDAIPSTFVFISDGLPAGATVGDGGKSITVPGEGKWTVDNNGVVTFVPEAGFNGTPSPVSYQARDASGALLSPATIRIISAATGPANVPYLSIFGLLAMFAMLFGGALTRRRKI